MGNMHNIPPHILHIEPISSVTDEPMMIFRVESRNPIDGKIYVREVKASNYQMWGWAQGDDLIQNCFPHLSADEREFLATGILPEQWNEMFGEDE